MSIQPKYLARPGDGAICAMNEDGTYSFKEHKEKFPDNIHYSYPYETLISCDFYPVTESDFERLAEIGKEYYEYISWSDRSDGHRGSKGGTLEEFRIYKNKQNHEANN